MYWYSLQHHGAQWGPARARQKIREMALFGGTKAPPFLHGVLFQCRHDFVIESSLRMSIPESAEATLTSLAVDT